VLTGRAGIEKEVKRRADVVGIFPGESSIVRLIGAALLEQNDEWQLQHRYTQVEAMAELLLPLIEGERTRARSPPASAPGGPRPAGRPAPARAS
jgi:putative transposase